MSEATAKKDFTPSDLVRFLYNSNPFYLISAAIVLYAQTVVFRTGGIDGSTLVPLGLNAAFTLLLAATSVFIVRWGRVWDDARSIFMCILLLLMVQSVSADSEALDGNLAGRAYLAAGFFFSLGVLESIRRQLAIRFPRGFLAGMYTVFGAFFAFPLILGELILRFPDNKAPSMWCILAFPLVMSILFAAGFFPAARRGNQCAEGSNTPWRAPFFPWSAAVMLWVGIVFRTYLVTISFHTAHGKLGNFGTLESGFGMYMLLPPIWAALFLITEYQKANRVECPAVVYILPPVLLLGAIVRDFPPHAFWQFRRMIFVHGLTPAALAFASLALFYLYAWLRRFKGCDVALFLTLLTAILFRVGSPCCLLVAGSAAMLLLVRFLICDNNTFTRTLCAVGAVVFAGVLCRNVIPWLVPIHTGMAVVMAIALIGREEGIREFRRVVGVLAFLFLFVMLAIYVAPKKNLNIPVPYFWFALEWVMGVAFALLARDRFFYWLLGGYGALAGGGLLWRFYAEVRHFKGVSVLFWAVFFFIGAFLISLRKGWRKKFGKETNKEEPQEEKTVSTIVLNEDFENFMACYPPEAMCEEGLRKQIDTYATGQVGQLNYCVNGMRALYASKVWEPLWHGIERGEDGLPRSRGKVVEDTPLPMRKNALNCRLLSEVVPEHFQYRIDYGRSRGLRMFLSMRMNDLHWIPLPDAQLCSDFWREHTQSYRAPYQAKWPGKALDYADPEVYDHFMKLALEILERYAPDGLELDWMRSPPCFRPGAEEAGMEILTRFMQEVRAAADAAGQRRGRRIELSVRMPSRPDDARRMGFDVVAWARAGWISQVTVGSYWGVTDFDPQLELWRMLLPTHVVLAAGIEIDCRAHPGMAFGFTNSAEVVRGFAASFLYRGAGLIYLFNHMDGRAGMTDKAAWKQILGEVGARETVEPLPRRHIVTFADEICRAEGMRIDAVLPLAPSESYPGIRLNVGGGTAGRRAKLVLGFAEEKTPEIAFDIRLNGIQVAPFLVEDSLPECPPDVRSGAVFALPEGALRDGDNLLEFGGPNSENVEIVWCEIIII